MDRFRRRRGRSRRRCVRGRVRAPRPTAARRRRLTETVGDGDGDGLGDAGGECVILARGFRPRSSSRTTSPRAPPWRLVLSQHVRLLLGGRPDALVFFLSRRSSSSRARRSRSRLSATCRSNASYASRCFRSSADSLAPPSRLFAAVRAFAAFLDRSRSASLPSILARVAICASNACRYARAFASRCARSRARTERSSRANVPSARAGANHPRSSACVPLGVPAARNGRNERSSRTRVMSSKSTDAREDSRSARSRNARSVTFRSMRARPSRVTRRRRAVAVDDRLRTRRTLSVVASNAIRGEKDARRAMATMGVFSARRFASRPNVRPSRARARDRRRGRVDRSPRARRRRWIVRERERRRARRARARVGARFIIDIGAEMVTARTTTRTRRWRRCVARLNHTRCPRRCARAMRGGDRDWWRRTSDSRSVSGGGGERRDGI